MLTLTGTAEANSTVTLFDGSTRLGTALVTGTGAWNFTTEELANGIHDFTVTATDTAGNTSAASSDFSVAVANSLPDIAVSINNLFIGTEGEGLLTGTSEANSTVSVYDSSTGTNLGQVNADSSGTWAMIVGSLTPNSVHSFTANAYDNVGNTGSAAAVYGTTGNDTFLGKLADEIFIGKGGNITYMVSGNFGNDTIEDFQASSSVVQFDRHIFSDFNSTMAHAAQVGSDVVISVDANNSLSLHNTLLSQLTANNFHFA